MGRNSNGKSKQDIKKCFQFPYSSLFIPYSMLSEPLFIQRNIRKQTPVPQDTPTWSRGSEGDN